MNKKLIAAAIAAAVALPTAAQAGVQIYGIVHVSIDWTDANATDFEIGDVFDEKTWSMASGAGLRDSRLGFKGSEDLGNGLKAIWKYEQALDLTDLRTGFDGARNAYIGLAGDWGTVLGGQHDTPLKISTGKLDYFGDTMADYNNTIGFNDVRAPNTVAYISPNMNGLTFAAAGHFSERVDDSTFGDGWSVAAMYSNNGLFAAAAYEDLEEALGGEGLDPTRPDLINKKWRLGLGYEMNAFGIGLIYENQDETFVDLGDQKVDLWQVQAKYTFGNNVVKGMFGQRDPDNFDKTDAWAIGWDYNLSKRTMAYALYADSENGLRVESPIARFGDSKGFSLGMKHKF